MIIYIYVCALARVVCLKLNRLAMDRERKSKVPDQTIQQITRKREKRGEGRLIVIIKEV